MQNIEQILIWEVISGIMSLQDLFLLLPLQREKWIDDKPSHKLSKADKEPSTDEQPPNPTPDDRQPVADTIDQGNKEKNLKPDKSQQVNGACYEKTYCLWST